MPPPIAVAWRSAAVCSATRAATSGGGWFPFAGKRLPPVAVARAEFGEAGASLVSRLACPMRGCNVPDLVAGTLFVQLESSFKGSICHLSLKRRFECTAQQWSDLVLGMERGKNHMLYVLTLKLQH